MTAKKSADSCHTPSPEPTYGVGETSSEGTAEMPVSQRTRPCTRHDVDPDLFFANDRTAVTAAKKLCAACPIQAECLEESLDPITGSEYGTFGGLSEEERNLLRRARRTDLPRSCAA